MSKIEVNRLTKIFGSHPGQGLERLHHGKKKDEILEKTGMTVGVNQASFQVEQGEMFVIMGLSGSGKSTLIRLVNRLIEPTDGEVLIDGKDITKMKQGELIETRRKKLGMVFQQFALFDHRTILSNIAYGLEIQGMAKTEREKIARQTLEDVGLKGYENSYPHQLSGGMQQRVGLGRALANDTDILLMDEAFSALDPLIRKEMQDELIHIQNKLGKTVLFITHDLDEALKLGDHIAIMKDGEIVQIGTAEDILENPANAYVADFVKDVDRSKVLMASHVMEMPDELLSLTEKPGEAILKMENTGASSLFVVGKDRHFKGLLTIDNAVKAHEENASIQDWLIQDIATTTPDTLLNDLIGMAVAASYPIVVLENGQLQGILSRVSILSGLVLGRGEAEKQTP